MRRALPLLTVLLIARSTVGCRQELAPAPRCSHGMVPIAGGVFAMGKSFEVTLDGYCLDEMEVTVADYARCVGAGSCRAAAAMPSSPLSPEFDSQCNANKADRQDHPINCVSWQDATDYCQAAGKRLPTEAEWEYAAHSSAEEASAWGKSRPTEPSACWSIEHQRSGTCAVGSYPASYLQLRDMVGNVSEWVSDWFGDYPTSSARNYRGPVRGTVRLTRGAGWSVAGPKRVDSAVRIERNPEFKSPMTGFRCASSR